jgi:hypothetical protein
VPDDPLDEGLTVVRVGKGYDKKVENEKGHECHLSRWARGALTPIPLEIWLQS